MPIAVWMRQSSAGKDPYVFLPRSVDDRDSPGAMLPIRTSLEATYFDVQVAHDVLMEQVKSKRKTSDWCGRLPLPCAWLEWRDEVMGKNVACVIAEGNPRYHANPVDGASYAMFWTMDGSEAKLFPIEVEVISDANGVVQRQFNSPLGGIDLGGDLDERAKVASYYMWTVFTALGLINCRNVETREAGRINLRRSGAQKRRGEPATSIRYSTIILPGGGSQSDGHGGHRATALHRVRGHFKTFTAEKPLMGQHVGTYWWGWNVRGNATNGVVVSDYELKH